MTTGPHHLRIAAVHAPVMTLGPGSRLVIWVQGCCFDCPGCTSPDWRDPDQGTRIGITQLERLIGTTPDIEGMTLSGGEPMLQAPALARLIGNIRRNRDMGIICYTGFRRVDIESGDDPDWLRLISLCDVLIDGPYVAGLDDNRGLRGSSNQQVHFLSPRYHHLKEQFLSGTRKIQLVFDGNDMLAAGIPPHGLMQDIHRIAENVNRMDNP